MDDYNLTSLQESNNEWVSRLISILTPCIINGCNSVYKEAYQLCVDNDEQDKYLMTFQNFLSRIPKWNSEILEKEVDQIKTTSGCDYLEDLITCVHIIQLKALTCIRVGMKHKAIDLDVPKLDQFIHKVYILLARKIYTNVYLFEENIPPLEVQRNNRELEVIIRECIMEAVRESIPVEQILRSYLDETIEENVETVVTTIQENANDVEKNTDNQEGGNNNATTSHNTTSDSTTFDSTTSDNNKSLDTNVNTSKTEISATDTFNTTPFTNSEERSNVVTPEKSLSFSNVDQAQNVDNTIFNVHAPKDVDTLERISDENHARRLLEEADGDDDEESLKISDEDANIQLDIQTL